MKNLLLILLLLLGACSTTTTSVAPPLKDPEIKLVEPEPPAVSDLNFIIIDKENKDTVIGDDVYYALTESDIKKLMKNLNQINRYILELKSQNSFYTTKQVESVTK